MLDDEQLVGALEELEHRGAHRALDEIDQGLRVDVARRADEQRPAAALVVGRDRDELEDLLDVGGLVACLRQPFGRPSGDEALRARAGVDADRLDADHPPRIVLGRSRDPDQRDHLLRRQSRHRRHAAHRPPGRDAHLGPNRALPLDDVTRDHLGDLLHDAGLAEHDVPDRLVEDLREARHVDALLAARKVDSALDVGRHHRLGLAAANPDRLLHAGHAGARKGELDRRRGRLHVGDEMRPVGHAGNVAARVSHSGKPGGEAEASPPSPTLAACSPRGSPQQPREAAVLQLLAAGLAGRAVGDRVLLEGDAAERVVPERTGLAEVPVDAVHVRVALPRLA